MRRERIKEAVKVTEFDHFYGLYGKRKRPQWGALRMHAGGISDGELMFPSEMPPSLPRRPENYLKNVRAGDVDVRRVESGCALAGLWL